MLVLTRKLQQQIKIGAEITITILRVKGNTVRVGVQAPRDVRVVRGELPKHVAAAAASEAATECAVQEMTFTADIDIDEHATAPADEASSPIVRATPLPLPAAAHLPLRRIHERRGAAPLKRIIASCGVLAK